MQITKKECPREPCCAWQCAVHCYWLDISLKIPTICKFWLPIELSAVSELPKILIINPFSSIMYTNLFLDFHISFLYKSLFSHQSSKLNFYTQSKWVYWLVMNFHMTRSLLIIVYHRTEYQWLMQAPCWSVCKLFSHG